MGWFRREPLHERLAREGGLGDDPREPVDTTPRWGSVGIHGVHRPRRWDAVATAEAPQLPGDELEFVVLPDGSLVVEDDVPDGALDPLADALGLEPPYRAEAVRRAGDLWAVAALQLEVVELPDDTPGTQIELTARGGERALVVDGMPSFGSVPALERVAGARYAEYAVRAERLDGTLWEIRVSPL